MSKVIPSDFFYSYVDPYFCNPIAGIEFSDKNFTDLLFADVPRPRCIFRYLSGLFLDQDYTIISEKDAFALFSLEKEVIIKPSDRSGGGKGIVFMKPGNEQQFKTFFSGEKYFIVQEVIKQHPTMSQLHPESLNTIRMITLIWKGSVHLLSSFIRIGVNGNRVDNAHAGGLFCGVDSSGMLQSRAVDYHFNIYSKHPQGCQFEGFQIPGYENCISLVKRIAPRLSRIAKMVSWDIAIDQNGTALLLESNMMYNGVDAPQIVSGPIFGSKTDEIIQEVKQNKKNRFRVL